MISERYEGRPRRYEGRPKIGALPGGHRHAASITLESASRNSSPRPEIMRAPPLATVVDFRLPRFGVGAL